MWLGEEVVDFKFRKPKPVSSARYKQQGIYYLVLELLKRQLNLFKKDIKQEISAMADFNGL